MITVDREKARVYLTKQYQNTVTITEAQLDLFIMYVTEFNMDYAIDEFMDDDDSPDDRYLR